MSSRPVAVWLCVVIVFAVSVASARQFVGWPLPATEIDFLLTPRILEASSAFNGTAYLSLAENLRAMSALPTIASALNSAGLSLERQMPYFAFVQVAAVCAAITALFFVLGGSATRWLAVGALALFVTSGRHYLFYFKLVSSTLVSGFVLLAIVLVLARRYWAAAITTGIVGAVHPTYFVLTLGAVSVVEWFNGSANRRARERVAPLWPFAVCGVPIVIAWASNSGAILQRGVEADTWFAYMTARSDLAFPLRQGYQAVLAAIVPLFLAVFVFGREPDRGAARPNRALSALAAGGIFLYLGQVVASELVKSATLTRLALSHRLPFTLDIFLFGAVIWTIVSRLSRSGLLAWAGLLYLGVLRPVHAGILPEAGLTDRGTLIFGALALQLMEDAVRGGDAARLHRVGGAWLVVAVAAWALGLGDGHLLFATVIVAAWAEATWRLKSRATVPPLVPQAALGLLCVAAAAMAVASIPWRATPQARQTRDDYASFIEFVTTHVPADATIVAVPFYLTQRYSPVPYRAMYLDWVESNYVLYLGSFLHETMARLNSYGIDALERPDGCTLASMFAAGKEGEPHFRCERLWFQRQAETDVAAWRDHVDDIRAHSPRTAWALVRQDLLCAGERGEAWKDLRLVPLQQIVRRADCVGR